MNSGLRTLGLGVAALGVSVMAAWQTIRSITVHPVEKGSAVSIVSQLNLQTGRGRAWSLLTSTAGFEALTGIRSEADTNATLFTKLGDSIGAEVLGEKGSLVVTMFDARRELRVVFEPTNANFLYARRIVLATAGESSIMQQWVQFTDFKPNAEEAANQTHAAMEKGLANFRLLAEK